MAQDSWWECYAGNPPARQLCGKLPLLKATRPLVLTDAALQDPSHFFEQRYCHSDPSNAIVQQRPAVPRWGWFCAHFEYDAV